MEEINSHIEANQENICMKCGLCCDGTLFNWAHLENNEKIDEAFKTDIQESNQQKSFSLPCPHLSNCTCTIYYSEKIKRPLVCGKFKCKLAF